MMFSPLIAAALRTAATISKKDTDTAIAALFAAALAVRYLPAPKERPTLVRRAWEILSTCFDVTRGTPLPCARPIARAAAAIRLCTALQDAALLDFADRAARDLLRRARGDGGFYGEEADSTARAGDALLRLALAELALAKRDAALAPRIARHWHSAAAAADLLCQSPHPTAAEAAFVARFARIKGEKERPYYAARAKSLFARAERHAARDASATAYGAYALYLLYGEAVYLDKLRLALYPRLAPLSPVRFSMEEAAFSAVGCLAETLFPTAHIRLGLGSKVRAEECRAVRSDRALTVIYTRPICFLRLSLAAPTLLLAPHLQLRLPHGEHTLCAATGRQISLPL